MASTIKFDNTEILSTTYNPRFLKHESDPEIELNSMPLPHEDGSVQVSDRTGSKVITVQGVLVGTSEADLESKIDVFKELFRRVNKNLDVNWNGGTRRYVASCQKHSFDRDHFNIGFVPWSAEFLCPTGIAEETTESEAVAATTFTTQEKLLSNIAFLGSAPPRPRFLVQNTSSTTTNAKGIEVKNDTTGERIIYTHVGGLASAYDTIFDCRLKTVSGWSSSATLPMSYYGVFPKFAPGNNNIRVRIGDITAEGWEEGSTGAVGMPIYTDGGTYNKPAQSFILPFTDATFQGVSLYLRKVGTPATDLTITIEGDSGGSPNGSAIATFTITAATFTDAIYDWRLVNSASRFQLNANTKYWIKCETAGGGGANYFEWISFDAPYGTYKRGNLATYSGGTWTQMPNSDAWFRVLFGGKFDNTKTYQVAVEYYKRWL